MTTSGIGNKKSITFNKNNNYTFNYSTYNNNNNNITHKKKKLLIKVKQQSIILSPNITTPLIILPTTST